MKNYTGENYTDNRTGYSEAAVRQPLYISWGAIAGGWVVAAAVAMLMYVLGTAIGVSAIDLTNAEALSTKVAVASIAWLFATWFIALYLGGYFAGSVSGDYNHGKKEGIGVWALSTVLTVFVGTAGLGLTGATGVLATAEATGGAAAAAAPYIANSTTDNKNKRAPGDFEMNLKDSVTGITGARSGGEETRIDGQVYALVAAKMIYGNEAEARNALAMHTNLSRAEIDQVSAKMSQEASELKAKAQAAAEKAAKYTQVVMWSAFLINLFSLFAAMRGGQAGKRRYADVVVAVPERNKTAVAA